MNAHTLKWFAKFFTSLVERNKKLKEVREMKRTMPWQEYRPTVDKEIKDWLRPHIDIIHYWVGFYSVVDNDVDYISKFCHYIVEVSMRHCLHIENGFGGRKSEKIVGEHWSYVSACCVSFYIIINNYNTSPFRPVTLGLKISLFSDFVPHELIVMHTINSVSIWKNFFMICKWI